MAAVGADGGIAHAGEVGAEARPADPSPASSRGYPIDLEQFVAQTADAVPSPGYPTEGSLRLLLPREQRSMLQRSILQGQSVSRDQLEVRVDMDGGQRWIAASACLEPAVIEGAITRGERLLAVFEAGRWSVVGALHTKAIPGIDKSDEVLIQARMIRLEGSDRVALVSGSSQMILRATGAIETLARRITQRASVAQKLIGRVLHLN